ncbi:MAG TPA: hypothetical protein VNI20_01055 [Fimbriimonadaceae bacterium]|nr:hypothetical protein [Fimbriimonadaceae bacterium]
MESSKRSIGIAIAQWVGAPLFLFALGFFLLGPKLGGGNSKTVTVPAPEMVSDDPVQDGPRTWTPPHPPQVDTSNVEEEQSSPAKTEETTPPPKDGALSEPPGESGGGDEAGVGGMVDPPGTVSPPKGVGAPPQKKGVGSSAPGG